jgi:hypothetical protein
LSSSLSAVLFGVVALFAVAASAARPSVGRIPEAAFKPDGIDASQVPHYVPALDRQGNVAGYVQKEDILPQKGRRQADGPILVVDESLERIVGHMHPGRGFVPLGRSLEDVPLIPETIFETGP